MGNLDYTQVLNKIENTRRFGNEPGVVVTAQVIKVLREKGKQKRIIPYIHVAGTNGKGSVCAFFSSILKKEHMRVGTFVSPHLVDFEERITVDGRMIPKEDVTRLGNYLLDIDFGIGLTMFDYCLAMALLYFEEQQCDYMVIETGLGGRLDSTNAIGTPQCAVITKIGYDHMAILGSDIADIAAEKAGIIKENGTVVVEQQDKRAMQVIEQEAQKKACTDNYCGAKRYSTLQRLCTEALWHISVGECCSGRACGAVCAGKALWRAGIRNAI